jgi:hypothetical protein
MANDEGLRREVAARLSVLQAIALAQARWREVIEAIETGVPLPFDGLTPEQEAVIMNIQFRRLAPGQRERVSAEIVEAERILRQLE